MPLANAGAGLSDDPGRTGKRRTFTSATGGWVPAAGDGGREGVRCRSTWRLLHPV